MSEQKVSYFSVKSLTPLFNYSTTKGLSKLVCRALKRNEKKYFIAPSAGGEQKQRFISEEELFIVLRSSQTLSEREKTAILEELQSLGFGEAQPFHSRDEIDFGCSLRKVLRPLGLNLTTQKRVEEYRADFYIPEVRLVVEYDENGHVGYNKEKEIAREKTILASQDVKKIVRVVDSKDHLENVGIVLREVLKMQPDLFETMPA